jgi:hypothetical protein
MMSRFKEGDWVRATADWIDLRVGDVCKVADVHLHGCDVKRDGDDGDDNLYYMENNEIEPWAPHFGERVFAKCGEISAPGTLIKDDRSGWMPYRVEFDCGKTLWCGAEDVAPLTTTPTEYKPGDRVRLTKDGRSTTGAVGKLATLEKWSSGDFVQGKEYLLKIDGPVDYETRAFTSEYTRATADCFERVAALKIEAGKYYRSRGGEKIGPMRLDGDAWSDGRGRYLWLDTGERYFATDRGGDTDLVAEWVDAPAAAKFKVGDRVVSKTVRKAGVGVVENIKPDGTYRVNFKDTWFGICTETEDAIEHAETETALTRHAIVCRIDNGQPMPADRPFVHDNEDAAITEATRLANANPGKKFGAYVLAGTRRVAKRYDHEWQRLAVAGRKIEAIGKFRNVTGLGLRPSKDAVEGWLKQAA